jgi:hypothetical protein
MMETPAIETQELRGISMKTLWALIVATAITVLTVMGSYTALKGEISDLKMQKDGDARYNDLRMKVLEQKVDMNTISLKDIYNRIEDTKTK